MDDILKRLGALEVSVGAVLATVPHLATKADLAKLEASLIKWMVATAISAAAASFAFAKFLH